MAAVDGGWGWLCMLGAFIVFLVTDGIERSFGIWYVEILEKFDSSAALTAWISGINIGTRLLLGPLASTLCHRWSPQIVTMLGGLLFSLSIFLSAFVDDVRLLLLTYGVVGGVGGALSYLPCYVVLAAYFERHRGVVFAIAQCGSGAGALLYAPLMTFLFSQLSYFEAVTVLAGVFLQIVPAGALFVLPPSDSPPLRSTSPAALRSTSPAFRSKTPLSSSMSLSLRPASPTLPFMSRKSLPRFKSPNIRSTSPLSRSTSPRLRSTPETAPLLCPTLPLSGSTSPMLCSTSALFDSKSPTPVLYHESSTSSPSSQPTLPPPLQCSESLSKSMGITVKQHRRILSAYSLLPPEVGELKDKETAEELQPLIQKPQQDKNDGSGGGFHFDLLHNPVALMIAAATCLFMCSLLPYLLLLVDFAVERGNPETVAALILTLCGAFEILARLLAGLVLQLPAVRPVAFPIGATCLAGIAASSLCTVWCWQAAEFATVAVLNTAFVGAFGSVAPLLLSLTFEEAVFGDIMGLYSFGLGVGSVSGTVLSGLLRDLSSSYTVSYVVMAVEALLAYILLMLCYGLIVRWRRTGRYRLRPSIP